MNNFKFALELCLCLGLALMPPLSVRAQDSTNTNITPVVTITPNLFASGTASKAFVSITNGNSNSTKTIRTGDSFTLTFDSSIGTLTSFEPGLLVNSSL